MTVATTATTARAAPSMAERTGTASAPVPGSRAKRTPVTTGAGAPTPPTARTTRLVRSIAMRLRRSRRWGAVRHAMSVATATSTTTRTAAPRPSTVQSKWTPLSG